MVGSVRLVGFRKLNRKRLASEPTDPRHRKHFQVFPQSAAPLHSSADFRNPSKRSGEQRLAELSFHPGSRPRGRSQDRQAHLSSTVPRRD